VFVLPAPARVIAAAALTTLAVAASSVVLTAPAESTSDHFAAQLIAVDTPTRAHKALVQSLGLDLTEHAGHDYVEVVLHTAAEAAALEAAGLTWDVRIPDLAARSLEVAQINEAYAASTAVSPMPSGRTSYRTLNDYNADMAALAQAKPKLVKLFTLPRPSLDGLPIQGIEIGSDVTRPESGRPVFLLMGAHHAREWPSAELTMEFAVDLVKSYGKDARITRLLDRARLIAIPVVNVDGFNLSRTDGEYIDLRDLNSVDGGTVSVLGTPGRAYIRKNCRFIDGQDTPDGACLAAFSQGGYGTGVDLNRNYGGLWGGPGAETLQADPTYRGAGPFSEPETQNIRDLVRTRSVTMMISNHTSGNLVLRPNGVNPLTLGSDGLPVGDAPDESAMKRLGARFSAQNGYQNIHGWQLYDTTGTTEDWSYNTTGGFGYTFEHGANEFHPPFPEVIDMYRGSGDYTGKGNRESFLIALEAAADPASHSVLKGKAPSGAVLRLTKNFQTPTWDSTFADFVKLSMKVPASGLLSWHVNPSTRPAVMSKSYIKLPENPVRSTTFEGTAPLPNESADQPFKITEQNITVWRTTLDWPLPDDFDLEVYWKKPGGELVQIGTSGNLPAEKESVTINYPAPGNYVLRVINYAGASPSYTLTADLFRAKVISTPGKRESYTLTCSKGNDVLQKSRVYVARGQILNLDLAECRRKW
jgi:hypothetical protein